MTTPEQTEIKEFETHTLTGESASGSTLVISSWSEEKGYAAVLTFRCDGKVVVGPNLSPDEATQFAVEALVKTWAASWPVVGTKALLDELSPADFLAVTAGRCRDCGVKTDGRTCHCTNDK